MSQSGRSNTHDPQVTLLKMQTLLAAGVGAVLLLVWVSACNQGTEKRANEWPPMLGWAEENFQENRDSLETLESMLLKSEFYEVKGGGGVIVGVYSSLDEGYDRLDIIDDDEEWAAHFRGATVFAVAKHDGYTAYPTGLNPFWDEKDYQHVDGHSELIGTLTYIHVRNMDEEEVVCHERHKISKCGACVVNIAPDWLAYYTWSAASFTPTSIEKSSEPKLEGEEIEGLSQQAYESCYSDWNEMIASSPE